jgi:lactoylglutathione lyase
VSKLPLDGPGPGFTQSRVTDERGAGVEIVLEVEDLEDAYARFARAGERVAEPIRTQPWGLRDRRLTRRRHLDDATSQPKTLRRAGHFA